MLIDTTGVENDSQNHSLRKTRRFPEPGVPAVIVCVCHAVCERRLEAVISAGADTAEKVERHCGAGGDCGACRPDIEHLIERVSLVGPRTTAAHASEGMNRGVSG